MGLRPRPAEGLVRRGFVVSSAGNQWRLGDHFKAALLIMRQAANLSHEHDETEKSNDKQPQFTVHGHDESLNQDAAHQQPYQKSEKQFHLTNSRMTFTAFKPAKARRFGKGC